jgi:hypothetical protein
MAILIEKKKSKTNLQNTFYNIFNLFWEFKV